MLAANHVHQAQLLPNDTTSPVLSSGYAHHTPNASALQNGKSLPDPPQPTPQPAQPAQRKERITVVGIPSVSVQTDRLIVGDAQSRSTRSYTPLKVLGDGSFGTVWLCDWHGTLPPNTPLSPMQCGARAKPEWQGKRLVAVKRMKKRWEGGWDECKKLKELESLRAITFHPNIIPLYDFFLLPASKELYFVFESMEGNLYHLIKARKNKPLAGGLVSSIFHQVVSGLCHMHDSGYFHRDMKPENILVTTTGLFDYKLVSPNAAPNATQQDVVVIIKLADFGLARETKSKPPYTEYVATRWYRAPEVLMLSRDYSTPVDMWALGTIMAELVNLRPLFPGAGQMDQISRICDVLGDPSDDYGVDIRGRSIGGGPWPRGVKMAESAGFSFPKISPKDIYSLFDRSVPRKLIECISDLLKYDADARLTSKQCLSHPYLAETLPKNKIPFPPGVHMAPSPLTSKKSPSPRDGAQTSVSAPNVSTRPGHAPLPTSKSASHLPHPHAHPATTILDALSPQRVPFYPSDTRTHADASRRPAADHSHANGYAPGADTMDMSDRSDGYNQSGQLMDIHVSPTLPSARPDGVQDQGQDASQNQGGKLSKFGFGKKTSKWGLGMFGQADKSHLPPVDEVPAVDSVPSLKRTQSSSSDSTDGSPSQDLLKPIDPKTLKKEAQRRELEAEKSRRDRVKQTQRDQARAVMQKRKQIAHQAVNIDLDWGFAPRYSDLDAKQLAVDGKAKTTKTPGPIRDPTAPVSTTVNATAAGRFTALQPDLPRSSEWRGNERMAKARRREYDDDHSMSSSDVQSMGRTSSMSFTTVDSDPGPSRLRTRSSLLGINRVTSRTSCDDFPASIRSSNSLSAEQHFAHDFHVRASVQPSTPVSGSVSPPPMQLLSLSPSLSPSPTWMNLQGSQEGSSVCSSRENYPYGSLIPQSRHPPLTSAPQSPYDFCAIPPSPYGQPPSPAPHSIINPIFKVPPFLPPIEDKPPLLTLPPFSHLEAVADREYPPLSPMAFNPPES